MTGAEIREMQRNAIVSFLTSLSFAGRVLDFGCGVAPYREIVEMNGGSWNGYNRAIYPGGAKLDIGPDDPFAEHWDVILCTQMLQYVPDVPRLLADFRRSATSLVLTYATNWPEVEPEDLHRFTRAGMDALLNQWTILSHRPLGALPFGDREHIALGYGLVAV